MKQQHKILFTALLLCFSASALKSQNPIAGLNKMQPPSKEIKIVSIDDVENIFREYKYEPKATFQNSGNIARSFEVCMAISGGYKSVKHVTLLPQAGVTVIFDEIILKEGMHVFSARVNKVTDDTDNNNVLSDSFVIAKAENINTKY